MLEARIEEHQVCLVSLLSSLGASCPVLSMFLEENLDLEATIRMLGESSPMVRVSLIKLLDGIMDRATRGQGEGAKLEGTVAELLRVHVYTLDSPPPYQPSNDIGTYSEGEDGVLPHRNIEVALNAVKTFGLIFKHGGRDFGMAALKAGGIGFLLQMARISRGALVPKSEASSTLTVTDLRSAAITCLDGTLALIRNRKIVPEHFPRLHLPKPEPRLELQGHILKALLDLIDDPDLTISDQVVEILYGRYYDPGNAVEIFLWTHEGSLERLIHKLALGGGKYDGRPGGRVAPLKDLMGIDAEDPETGSPPEVLPGTSKRYSQTSLLLHAFFDRIPQGVVEAFGKFWTREAIDGTIRDRLACVLTSREVHRAVRNAAVCGGVPVPVPNPASREDHMKRAERINRRETEYRSWLAKYTTGTKFLIPIVKVKISTAN
ncbi:hypothetical protein FA13DRAFT_1732082 [Coprinellus micaceus]|uniref:Uncharacterized protein n=1 Tax=Coprinellus micaceus TaxID=71717 RepID=A0A4Y7TC85_COPMI|nr:hypothetical protein FA13DRAFT_1732082 [Coprinellus micaceus]